MRDMLCYLFTSLLCASRAPSAWLRSLEHPAALQAAWPLRPSHPPCPATYCLGLLLNVHELQAGRQLTGHRVSFRISAGCAYAEQEEGTPWPDEVPRAGVRCRTYHTCQSVMYSLHC